MELDIELDLKFESLKGKVVKTILLDGVDIEDNSYNEELSHSTLTFITEDLLAYELYHEQDCCENVELEEIVGDLRDSLHSKILGASIVTNPDCSSEEEYDEEYDDEDYDYYDYSYTWTFYNIKTRKEYVTLRWYGESNGYYSEEVDLRVSRLVDYYTDKWYGAIANINNKLLYINFNDTEVITIKDALTGKLYDYVEESNKLEIDGNCFVKKLDEYGKLEIQDLEVIQYSSSYEYLS